MTSDDYMYVDVDSDPQDDLLQYDLSDLFSENDTENDENRSIFITRSGEGVLTLSAHAGRNYTQGCNISLDADWLTELDERYRSIHGWLVLLVCTLGIAANLTNIAGRCGLLPFYTTVTS